MGLDIITCLFLQFIKLTWKRLFVVCLPIGLFFSTCMGMGPHMRGSIIT